jgi:cytochrome c-type biogenesis protein CcmH
VISRRELLRASMLGAGTALASRPLFAQQPGLVDTSNLFAMDQSAARSVRLPPKPGARPSMSAEERDALEHRIRCQCGCTLDVFTCRTTDFSCQVSPAMHRDVMALVAGGYGAPEILAAFVTAYGEQALMAPPRQGFNLVGYVLPGFAVFIGAILLLVMIRRWRRRQVSVTSTLGAQLEATPDELRRIEAAVRDDS